MQTTYEALGFFRLAFPDCDHTPTEAAECSRMAFVAGDISFELFAPPNRPCFGNPRVLAIAMEVPETSVHKNADSMPRENNVGIAGKIAAVREGINN